MSTITIRTTEKEKELIKAFTEFNGVTMSDFIKETILEKIEDAYDLRIAEESLAEYHASGEKAIDFDDVLKEFGLD
ncbi:MAG TPA: DUF6290 family protein [Erysipelothrix sp.]|nr:DUF6290 family protein [Erysipelothrix sp.]